MNRSLDLGVGWEAQKKSLLIRLQPPLSCIPALLKPLPG